jgi:hypothetical protein
LPRSDGVVPGQPAFGRAVYLDLERPSDSARLADPELYLEPLADRLVVIDEIQRLPALFPVLRSLLYAMFIVQLAAMDILDIERGEIYIGQATNIDAPTLRRCTRTPKRQNTTHGAKVVLRGFRVPLVERQLF